MTTVVLLRHGETEWNRISRVQGWSSTPLNDRGRRQAYAAGQHLSEAYGVDRLVASDLERTRETAAHARKGGIEPEPEFDAAWRERCFGDFEGESYEAVFGRYPDYDTTYGMVGLPGKPDGGESLEEMRERVLGGWERLLEESDPDDTALVVTHGGPIYLVFARVMGIDPMEAAGRFSQTNCAINELRHDHETGETAVRIQNETSYRE